MTVFAKDPSSRVDYSFDWSSWLLPDEAVSSAGWSAEPAIGITLDSPVDAGSVRGIHVTGGEAGHRYRLSCCITTDAGREAERSVVIRVMEQ